MGEPELTDSAKRAIDNYLRSWVVIAAGAAAALSGVLGFALQGWINSASNQKLAEIVSSMAAETATAKANALNAADQVKDAAKQVATVASEVRLLRDQAARDADAVKQLLEQNASQLDQIAERIAKDSELAGFVKAGVARQGFTCLRNKETVELTRTNLPIVVSQGVHSAASDGLFDIGKAGEVKVKEAGEYLLSITAVTHTPVETGGSSDVKIEVRKNDNDVVLATWRSLDNARLSASNFGAVHLEKDDYLLPSVTLGAYAPTAKPKLLHVEVCVIRL